MSDKIKAEDLGKLHDLSFKNQIDLSFPNVARVEVIDGNGRVYTNYDVQSCTLLLQDDNKTLKIMVGN